MNSIKFKGKKIIIEISNEFYLTLIRIQGKHNLSFEEACDKAAIMIDPRTDEFNKQVNIKAETLCKSRFMTQLNKSKQTIADKKYDEGFCNGYEDKESEYVFPCGKCNKEIPMNDEMWELASKFLSGRWIHVKCD